MSKKKTLAKKEKNLEEDSEQESEMEKIQQQNFYLQEVVNLTDKNYFNRRILSTMERIASSLEGIKELLQEDSEEENSEEDEED